MRKYFIACLAAYLVCSGLLFKAYALKRRSEDPYTGAIVIEAGTGKVLFDDNADRKTYPASMVKLMDLLIILEKTERGELKLSDKVLTTAESARMGGTQVFLKEGEVFTIDELLYALVVRSANDAAVALAIHIAGSKEAFVELMNKRARELGMGSTEFHSVHGLPPGRGQKPDISTARDMALLSREIVKRPAALKYTSTEFRKFRNGTFDMRTHNPVIGTFPGADGLKTGYFRAAGFSLSATALRHGRRVIAVILGSRHKKVRNTKIRELLSLGFVGQNKDAPLSGIKDKKSIGYIKNKPDGPMNTESAKNRASPGKADVRLKDAAQADEKSDIIADNESEEGVEGLGRKGTGIILIIAGSAGALLFARLFLRRKKKKGQFYELPP